MRNIITKSDLALITQPKLDLSIKIEVFSDSNNLLAVVQSNIIDGNFTIDSESDIRRTCSITVKPDKKKSIVVEPDGYIWINKMAKIYVGIKNIRTKQYVWYSQGCYYFKDTSSTYDATTNTLSISACDPMSKLDGTKNGNIGGSLNIVIPAYETDEETGEIIKYNIIRDAIISAITQFGNVTDYMVDDIGEQNGMEQINANWQQYRQEHPFWNVIPYDLEFPTGSTILSLISTLRDLYSNYETFFDTDGTFICQMISNCDSDDIIFDDTFFQKILISEGVVLDLSSVRNICEVWGKVIESDYYADVSSYSNGVYSCTIDGYEKYGVNDKISFCVTDTNSDNSYLQINELDALPIYDETTDTYISKQSLIEGKIYSFKITRVIKDDNKIYVAYLLGQWQPHAISVLSDGTDVTDDYVTSSGISVKKYSEDYFKDKYNCDVISISEIPNSPFSVQKIGEILNVKQGGEFENISSDSLALERAEYENWKTTRLTDTVTIKTFIVPFADVNIKCSYRCAESQNILSYVVKSITHDFQEGTTTWTMYRHYPSMKTILESKGTYRALSYYPHSVLSLYTHEELSNFLEGGTY